MRKKIRTTPARAKLPVIKETVRTLDATELADVQTGQANGCPTTMSTSQSPPDV